MNTSAPSSTATKVAALGVSAGALHLLALAGHQRTIDVYETLKARYSSGIGAGRCACGRTISKNKAHCLACASEATK